MAEFGGTDLHHLPDGQALVICGVEDLALGLPGLVDGEQQGVSKIFGEAEGVEHGAAVGQHDVRPVVEDAAHHRPLARRELPRSVDPRVAEVGRLGLMLEQLPLSDGDAVGLAVVGFGRGGRVLGHRCGQPGW